MKLILIIFAILLFTGNANAQTNNTPTATGRLFLDVHYLQPGKVTAEDVAAAHAKDLAVENKYGVHFINYWVDEANGVVYCLSSASDTTSIINTHREAHGLLPQEMHEVTDGVAASPKDNKTYFMDVHKLGKVTASDVAKAHEKDLAVQSKYGVHFINYWVDEKNGLVYCLSQAASSANVIQTHKEAHGLLPDSIVTVKQGQ